MELGKTVFIMITKGEISGLLENALYDINNVAVTSPMNSNTNSSNAPIVDSKDTTSTPAPAMKQQTQRPTNSTSNYR